jgi:hypothetical protein
VKEVFAPMFINITCYLSTPHLSQGLDAALFVETDDDSPKVKEQ